MKNNFDRLSIMIGAPAGAGIKTAGTMLARAFSRAGLHVFTNNEYPSIIRGENNSCQIMVGTERIHAHSQYIDIMLALDRLTLDMHKDNLSPQGIIIYDGEKVQLNDGVSGDPISIPLAKIVNQAGGKAQLINVAGLAAMLCLLDFDLSYLKAAVEHTFGARHHHKIDINFKVIDAVETFVKKQLTNKKRARIAPLPKAPERMLITGNEAVALGAIQAGIKFFASYPMTPASSIMTTLAAFARDFNIVVMQAEDEIAAANMAVGAAFAGVRSMVGTSGGGFCLMSEALGLAGMTETPLVMVESQRPGPSTGLPTRTAQGDLQFVLNASQGEFPRIVIAPATVRECFEYAFHAFNIAEKLQTPVILLLDKQLSECQITQEPFQIADLSIDRSEIIPWNAIPDPNYQRYKNTPNGISPRALSGTPGYVFTTTGDEHNEWGHIEEEEAPVAIQYAKRMRKELVKIDRIPKIETVGHENADITFLAFGSMRGPILEAMNALSNDGITTRLVRPIILRPFPVKELIHTLKNKRKLINVEQNMTGQLAMLIREQTGITTDGSITKYTGRQLFPEEIYRNTKELIK